MKRLTWLPVFGIILLLPGCYSASLLEFDGLKPAEVTITPAIKSLSVVSRSDLDAGYKSSLSAKGRIEDFYRDSTLSKQIVLGCSDALLESPRFTLFNPVVTRTLNIENSSSSIDIPWDRVRKIAGDPPQDAVLSLVIGNISDTLSSTLLDGWYKSFKYVVVVKTVWMMYRLSDFQSKEYTFLDTVSFEVDSPITFTSSADIRFDYLKSAMYNAGIESAKRLAPWWTSFQRYCFNVGRIKFFKASELLKNGNWREAADIWRPYTASKRQRLASEACFNMALTSEIAGNIPAALDWLKQSQKLGMDAFYIQDYQSLLKRRKVETDLLDLQIK